ncbi:MAG TPA: insulinase family protein, partial [Xanthomonadales bacterium]|nr:insulinase family protein [Xanthomonadales bacterium]
MTVVAFAAGVLASAGAASAQESQIVPGAASTPPPPGAPRTVQYPTPVATTLPNGLRVLAVRVSGSALVAADLTVPGGAVADPDATPGVASLTASLLTRGTAKRSAKEVAFALDAMGATLVANPSNDRTDVVTDAVAARFPAALALLAEAVRQPAFAPAELTLAKQRATSAVTLQNGSPSALANLVAQRALFAGAFGRPTSG